MSPENHDDFCVCGARRKAHLAPFSGCGNFEPFEGPSTDEIELAIATQTPVPSANERTILRAIQLLDAGLAANTPHPLRVYVEQARAVLAGGGK